MAWMKGWYDEKTASVPEEGRPDGDQPIDNEDQSYDMLNYNTFDSMNETYWEELMADFGYMPMQQFGAKDLV
jgi:hypothetical protein